MKTFKKFFESRVLNIGVTMKSTALSKASLSQSLQVKLSAENNLAAIGSILVAGNLDDRVKFSNQVAELVVSENFLENFSSNIGSPGDDETEEVFVNRAKDVLKRLLNEEIAS